MPIHKRIDSRGSYFQYGNHGKKYYFDILSDNSIINAYNKALKQQTAIYLSGYREIKI